MKPANMMIQSQQPADATIQSPKMRLYKAIKCNNTKLADMTIYSQSIQ